MENQKTAEGRIAQLNEELRLYTEFELKRATATEEEKMAFERMRKNLARMAEKRKRREKIAEKRALRDVGWLPARKSVSEETTPYWIRKKFYTLRNQSKKREVGFELDLDFFVSICVEGQPCPLCGTTMLLKTTKRPEQRVNTAAWSIDRLDNRMGYVKGNVRALCYLCNITRNTHTPQTWKKCVDGITRDFEKLGLEANNGQTK